MSITITIEGGLHSNVEVTLDEGNVYVLIGKNGAGKSRLLQGIKNSDRTGSNIILLSGSYESVSQPTNVNLEEARLSQIQTLSPVHVQSAVSADPTMTKIFQYFFRVLFDADITFNARSFQINGFELYQEADGYRAIFNLLYYLISDHRVILLDEPERFFHPTMKSVFISLVSEIAKNYNKVIVLTSHSDEAVRFDLDNVSIWLLKPQVIKLNSWLGNITHPGYPNARDKQQFIDWITHHTEVFFAKSNCLVEGVSDEIVLEAIRNKLALKYNLENISVSHVAASNHEAGGKSRLHKFQAFLGSLNSAFVIADKDIIVDGVTKWITPAAGEAEAKVIADAKAHHLHILENGEIEDYYFLHASFDFCTDVVRAKANKVSAAYEQARIISTKSINEVEVQFAEIVEILKSYGNAYNYMPVLKELSKSYLLAKYVLGDRSQERHIEDAVSGDTIDINFKFAGHGKSMNFPTDTLKKIQELDQEIETGLT